MKSLFVPKEEAILLRDMGCDVACLASWNFYTNDFYFNGIPSTFTSEHVVQLPTYSQAFYWFRDIYNLNAISPTRLYIQQTDLFIGRIIDWNTWEETDSGYFQSYGEAELGCLRKLIDIVKEKLSK